MLTDGRRLLSGDELDADVCIIGGGPAGITLALQFVDGPWRVILLESGDLEVREAAQALNGAASVSPDGHPYPALDASRVRAFGGTTHRWGGWCHPLQEDDFERRDWVPGSGWPFPRSHLGPYYARARAVFGLTSADPGGTAAPPLPIPADSGVEALSFAIAPIRLGAAHLPRLRAARNVNVVLQASALRLLSRSDGTSARSVEVASECGSRFAVRARVFILAAGGLENPRLLLSSVRSDGVAVGNAHDLVGRYFADHLHVPIGTVRPTSLDVGRSFARQRTEGATTRAGLSLSAPVRREHALLGSAVTLHNADDPHDVASPGAASGGYPSLMVVARAFGRGQWPDAFPMHLSRVVGSPLQTLALSYRKLRTPPPKRLVIALRAEQSPNRDSRVVLDDALDAFGMPRLRLEWRLAERDLDSIDRTQRLLARHLAVMRPDLYAMDGPDGWLAQIAPGAHHMGTTRMHPDPRHGVVDEHGLVHGMTNVFVAGSSVFPTGGWAPPTLTIVALALRLAEHLQLRLRDTSAMLA